MVNQKKLSPEQTGSYLLGVLLAGVRTGIYRLLFNFYVISLGYEEGLITVFITASVMSMAISVLPLSYIVDYAGKRYSLIFSIIGTVMSLLIMILFPSRLLFLMLNMILGTCQALTQVSLGSENSRYMKLMDRFIYYSLPLAFAIFTNYAISYLPNWLGFGRDISDSQIEFIFIGIVALAIFIYADSQYNNQMRTKTPRRVVMRLTVGNTSIPIMVREEEEDEVLPPIQSIADQVNMVLQGMLQQENYEGPDIKIDEDFDQEVIITVEGEGTYSGVEQMPEGEARALVQRATDRWVEMNFKG